jgi:hypothetical protein
METPLAFNRQRRRSGLYALGALALGALLTGEAQAQLRDTPGLTSIRLMEVTGPPVAKTFAANAAQLAAQLPNPLGPSNVDFFGLANEYYDVFYSDASGAPDPQGDYLTVECQFSGVGGLNLEDVHLEFADGSSQCACAVTQATYLGNGQIAGSAAQAADCTPGTLCALGSTSSPTERLSITFDFCLPACFVVPGDCCAGRPAFVDPNYTFTGQVAVGTASRSDSISPVLTVYDFSPATFVPPPGANMAIGRYSASNWTAVELGSIFGVTFDRSGNIYATATTTYAFDQEASGGMGAVYRIDRLTGAVTVFATLPNSGPGLGNIAYDCEHDQFFVTNHENGCIHRISNSGALLSTFDFGLPDDGSDGFAPLGERLWGITVHAGRVWFGVWHEDFGRQSLLADNEVWSVDLDADGDTVGLARKELTVIPPAPLVYTNPVSDLRFTPSGSLLIAQRGMSSDTWPQPHVADGLEFVCDDGLWVPSSQQFILGQFGRDCSGGLDFDYGTGNRAWWSTDAMSYPSPSVYGFQGVPATGGTIANSYWLDYDGATAQADKTFVGDIAISCSDCAYVYDVTTKCTGVGQKFKVTFKYENQTELPIPALFLHGLPAGLTANPSGFNAGMLQPLDSISLTTTISGAAPYQEFCFQVSIGHPAVYVCPVEVCVQAPGPCPLLVDVSNLQSGGPGFTYLDLGGDPVDTGGVVDILTSKAPAQAPCWLVFGLLNNPVPVLGGTLVPIDMLAIVPGTTDAAGDFVLPFNISQSPPVTLYGQAVVLDFTQPQLFGFSNAVQIQIF